MKSIRFCAIGFSFVTAGLILVAPSLSQAHDGFSVVYTSGSHDRHALTLSLGHLVGLRIGHDQPHPRAHRRPRVAHATPRHHAHDSRCGHLRRSVHQADGRELRRYFPSAFPRQVYVRPQRAHHRYARHYPSHGRRIRAHHDHD